MEKTTCSKCPCAFLKKKKFWISYFLPLFLPIFIFGLCYTFLCVKDQYQAKGTLTTANSLDYVTLRSIGDVSASLDAAKTTAEQLDQKGIRHFDGSVILPGEISSGISSDYHTWRTQVFISFTTTDSSIAVDVLNIHLSSIVEKSNELPALKNELSVFDTAIQQNHLDNYRYFYILSSSCLGFSLSCFFYYLKRHTG